MTEHPQMVLYKFLAKWSMFFTQILSVILISLGLITSQKLFISMVSLLRK